MFCLSKPVKYFYQINKINNFNQALFLWACFVFFQIRVLSFFVRAQVYILQGSSTSILYMFVKAVHRQHGYLGAPEPCIGRFCENPF